MAMVAAARGVATGAGSIPDSRAAQRVVNGAVVMATVDALKDAAMTDVIVEVGASTIGITRGVRGIGMWVRILQNLR